MFKAGVKRIRIVDSHTGGEPTRVVLAGGPELGTGTLAERVEYLRRHHDRFRSAVVNEPRGSDVHVGALLVTPRDPACTAGVIFFNNIGYLGMCGHGTIGLLAVLHHIGRIRPGDHRIETPVGIVSARLDSDGAVSVRNVPSYRSGKGIRLDVPGLGAINGDIAWGGNWFFLVSDHGQTVALDNVERLTECAWQIRQTLQRNAITGDRGAEIDHIELFAPPDSADVHSRSFVLCPGKAYDRSPCGTGTSAKMACLYADGRLQPGQIWRQQSIVGTVFEGWIEVVDGIVHPFIKSRAFVNAEADLILDPGDPFCMGIRR